MAFYNNVITRPLERKLVTYINSLTLKDCDEELLKCHRYEFGYEIPKVMEGIVEQVNDSFEEKVNYVEMQGLTEDNHEQKPYQLDLSEYGPCLYYLPIGGDIIITVGGIVNSVGRRCLVALNELEMFDEKVSIVRKTKIPTAVLVFKHKRKTKTTS
jgi:hypothetical protein